MTYDLKYIDDMRSRLLGGRADDAVRLPGKTEGDGESIIFVLDMSGSMWCKDYRPTRFLAGVDSACEFLKARIKNGAEDIIGAVTFDTSAATISRGVPAALAMDAVIRPLRRSECGGGTDIAQGLSAANACLRSITHSGLKRAILLSDGFGGDPIPVASAMKREGIIIDVIGIGGSRETVNEESLIQVASVVDGSVRYRFIGDRADLMSHFEHIATELAFRS